MSADNTAALAISNSLGGAPRRGYIATGNFIELGATCQCGRAVEAADVDLDAERLSIICSGCHKIILRLELGDGVSP
jgi:hypothetical protein